jgi:tetratricopeptide (TPR) repeat protein
MLPGRAGWGLLSRDEEIVGPVVTRPSRKAGRVIAMQALGTLLLARGETSEAVALLDQALELWEELLGRDHPSTAGLFLAHAAALRAAGRDEDADQSLESARLLAGGDIDRRSSPILPVVLHELGVEAADRGDPSTAGALLDEASMIAGSLLPPQHPIRAQIHYTRGLVHLAEDDPDRALAELSQAVEQRREHLGRDHPATHLAEAAMALATVRQGPAFLVQGKAALGRAGAALARELGPDSREANHIRALFDGL